MNGKNKPPVYSQVAFDIATKISIGALGQGAKFSGRSLMSAEYGVSQETIRRALNILSEMGIIEITKCGAVVRSKDSAADYIKKFNSESNVATLKHELKKLMEVRAGIDERITQIIDRITDLNERFKHTDPLRNYEFEIGPSSQVVGKTITESGLRNKTGAIIVALRRDDEVILTPSPQEILQPYDILVVTARPDAIGYVREFIN